MSCTKSTSWSVRAAIAAIVLSAGACSSNDIAQVTPIAPPATTSPAELATTDDTSPDSNDTDDQASTDGTTPPSTPPTTIAPAPVRLSGSYTVEVVSSTPHDPTAYTQGLELDGDRLLESTGLYGESGRRWLDPTSGAVLVDVDLPDDLFGEGITIVDGAVVQLTWKAGVLLVADGESLVESDRQTYTGEGWGLCSNGSELVMSDGSSTLAFRDPQSFDVQRVVTVVDAAGQPVSRLNELECVGDQVLANIYGLDSIAVIDPLTGQLDALIDASSLRPDGAPRDDLDYALNGIAHDPATDRYFLTGKWWDVMYDVRLVAN